MLAHISLYLGFLEEAKQLISYPEITADDTAYFSFDRIDIETNTHKHNGRYDVRLFYSLTNHFRKLLITTKEPISLENTHKKALKDLCDYSEFANLAEFYDKIQKYLNSNMNTATKFSFSMPDSALERTSVHALLNNYFAALAQHSKPDAQSVIFELNVLTHGALPEMVRIMIIDLIKLLNEYAAILKPMICK